MPSKNFALGACMLIACTALANNKTYAVQKGDTLQTIAKRFHVSAHDLAARNHLSTSSIRKGMSLLIPTSNNHNSSTIAYRVTAGDNDWVLAHRFGIGAAKLRAMNPGVDWLHLKIGSVISVPRSEASAAPTITSRYAVINADYASLRKGPDEGDHRIASIGHGTRAVVLDFDGGWYRLKFNNGTSGWMRGDLIKATSAPVPEVRVARADRPAHESRVAARKVHPRFYTAARIAHHAESPTVAQPAEAIDSSSGDDTRTTRVSALLSRAMGMRGTRYGYGHMSANRVDCSGFTSIVFGSQGIKLPRTSRSQATVGVPVHRANLEPGDLVFFGTRRIHHVGIYVGDGKFIHASSGHGQVRVDSLDGHYGERLAAARRIIGDHAHSKGKAPQKGKSPKDASGVEEIPMVPDEPAKGPSSKKE